MLSRRSCFLVLCLVFYSKHLPTSMIYVSGPSRQTTCVSYTIHISLPPPPHSRTIKHLLDTSCPDKCILPLPSHNRFDTRPFLGCPASFLRPVLWTVSDTQRDVGHILLRSQAVTHMLELPPPPRQSSLYYYDKLSSAASVFSFFSSSFFSSVFSLLFF